jgi:Fe-S-cluster containining protein
MAQNKCERCGDCCKNEEEHSHACVLTNEEAAKDLFKKVVQWDGLQWVIPYDQYGKCPFLIARGCAIHTCKPIACKDYGWWI